jgi:hypothetical protein
MAYVLFVPNATLRSYAPRFHEKKLTKKSAKKISPKKIPKKIFRKFSVNYFFQFFFGYRCSTANLGYACKKFAGLGPQITNLNLTNVKKIFDNLFERKRRRKLRSNFSQFPPELK